MHLPATYTPLVKLLQKPINSPKPLLAKDGKLTWLNPLIDSLVQAPINYPLLLINLNPVLNNKNK
jgi:hypothetical protein